MTTALAHSSSSPVLSLKAKSWSPDFDIRVREQNKRLNAPFKVSESATTSLPAAPTKIEQKTSLTFVKEVPHQDVAVRIFDSLVSLKVAVSEYAMHLSQEERNRIFNRLDAVINVEDWHEEDTLPRLDSFKDFLKWMIYAKRYDWASIGVSESGNTLIAWTTPDVTLTASFGGKNNVSWTATIETVKPQDHAVGRYTLRNFAKQALFYLSGQATNADD
jgi:hypothetical protein